MQKHEAHGSSETQITTGGTHQLKALVYLIGNDAFAMSFQSVRQYREALLNAAPTGQGEPVAWALPNPDSTDSRPFLVLFHSTSQVNDPSSLVPLYAAPQPAAHQPCPEGIRDGAPYDDPAFESLCREYGIWGTAAAAQCAVFWGAGKRVAEQKAAPDVAGLVEALEGALNGRPLDTEFWDRCEQFIAAHRKGGE